MRLHAHLASLDVKRSWDDLQPKLRELEQDVEARGEQALEASKDAIATIGGTLRKLLDQLQDAIDAQTPKGR